MLRITCQECEGEPVQLTLDGRLTGAEIPALDAVCDEWAVRSRRLVLDLAGVRFADADGVAALRRLRGPGGPGVVIANPTPFVSELLQREEGS